jgi:hypothetical protein
MTLDKYKVTTAWVIGSTEEMVEANVVQGRSGCKTGDMPTELTAALGGAQHHGQRVPADQGTYTPFDLVITRVFFTLARRNGVDVRGGGIVWQMATFTAGKINHQLQQEMCAFQSFALDDCAHGLQPFLCLQGISILGLQ